MIAGAATNIASGLLVSRVKANHIALAGAIGTMIAPLLMANMDLEWSYWRGAFWAMCLCPLSADGNASLSHRPSKTFPSPPFLPFCGVLFLISFFGLSDRFVVFRLSSEL